MDYFLVLVHGKQSAFELLDEEKQKSYIEKWLLFVDEIQSGPSWVAGGPLEDAILKLCSGGPTHIHGAAGQSDLCGFMLVRHSSEEKLVELLSGCPVMEIGGHVDIRRVDKEKMAQTHMGEDI